MIASELIARVTVQGAEKAKADLLGVGAASDDVGAKLAKGLAFGALAAGVAIVGVGIAATKMAADFQQQVNRLKTGGGDIQDTFNSLWTGIQKVADSTGVMTKPLSEAMYLVVSSGQRGAQAMNTLQAAAQGAQIEMANVTDVAQILTTIQTNFGLTTYTATQYMDGLVSAVSHGKITLQDLSTAMSPILPMAHELGIHFSDVSAALADMTNQGVPADRAAQALRFTMQSLIQPTKASRTAMQEWGLDSAKAAETMKTSLPDALQMYIDAAKRAGAEGTQPFIDALGAMVGGGTRAGQALWALSQSMGTWRADIAAVNVAMKDNNTNVIGWETAQKNLNIQLDRGKASLETMLQNIGIKLIPILTPLVSRFTDWAASIGQVVSHTDFSGLTTAIQGVATGVGNVFDTLGKVAKFTMNSQSWKDAATAIGTASDQLGTFTTRLQAAIAQNKDASNAVTGAWNGVGDALKQTADAFSIFGDLGNFVMDKINQRSISTRAAFLLMGKDASTAMLSTADATWLLESHITSVHDAITGADINLQKYVKTSDLSGSSTVTLAHALELVGKHAGELLTTADDAKLLAMNIGNVKDMSTGMVTDLKTATQGGSVMVAMYQKWLDVLKKGTLISWGDFQAQQNAIAQAAIKKTAASTQDLQAKLLNLNKPEKIDIQDSAVALAKQHTAELQAKLLDLNRPVKPTVDVSSVQAAGNVAHSTYLKLVALTGTSTWTAYANINQINNVTNVVSTIAASGPGNRRASGGMITEPVIGFGLRTGQRWTFGEEGPEMVTPLTGGARSRSGGASSAGGSEQPIILQIDGQTFARLILPHVVSQVRNAVGVVNI